MDTAVSNFSQAIDQCANHTGQLAIIDTPSRNTAVLSLMGSQIEVSEVYIGAVRSGSEFVWMCGTDPTFSISKGYSLHFRRPLDGQCAVYNSTVGEVTSNMCDTPSFALCQFGETHETCKVKTPKTSPSKHTSTTIPIVSAPAITAAPCPGVKTATGSCFFIPDLTISIGYFGEQECSRLNARLGFVNTLLKHRAVVSLLRKQTYSLPILTGAFMVASRPTGTMADFVWKCLKNFNHSIPVSQGYSSHFSVSRGGCVAYGPQTAKMETLGCMQRLYLLCEIVIDDPCSPKTLATVISTPTSIPNKAKKHATSKTLLSTENSNFPSRAVTVSGFSTQAGSVALNVSRSIKVFTPSRRLHPVSTASPNISNVVTRRTPIGAIGYAKTTDAAQSMRTGSTKSFVPRISSATIIPLSQAPTTHVQQCPNGIMAEQSCFMLLVEPITIGYYGEAECGKHNARLAFVDTVGKHEALTTYLKGYQNQGSLPILVGAFRKARVSTNSAADFKWQCLVSFSESIPVTSGYVDHMTEFGGGGCMGYSLSDYRIHATRCIQQMYVLCEIPRFDQCDVTATTTHLAATRNPSLSTSVALTSGSFSSTRRVTLAKSTSGRQGAKTDPILTPVSSPRTKLTTLRQAASSSMASITSVPVTPYKIPLALVKSQCMTGIVVEDSCFQLLKTPIMIAYYGEQECAKFSSRLAFVDSIGKHTAVAKFLDDVPNLRELPVLVGAFQKARSSAKTAANFVWQCLASVNQSVPVISGYSDHLVDFGNGGCTGYSLSDFKIHGMRCVQEMYILCEITRYDQCEMRASISTTPSPRAVATVSSVGLGSTYTGASVSHEAGSVTEGKIMSTQLVTKSAETMLAESLISLKKLTTCMNGVIVGASCFQIMQNVDLRVAYYAESECRIYNARLAFVDTEEKHRKILEMMRLESRDYKIPVLTAAFKTQTISNNVSDYLWQCMDRSDQSVAVVEGYIGHFGDMSTGGCAAYDLTSGQVTSSACISTGFNLLCETVVNDICRPLTTTTPKPTTVGTTAYVDKMGCVGAFASNSCFTWTPTENSFFASVVTCHANGGRLAHVDSQEKHWAVENYLKTLTNISTPIWVGGITTAVNPGNLSEFVWLCGSNYLKSVELSSGFTGHIQGNNITSSCMAYMRTPSGNFKINFVDCGSNNSALCEFQYATDTCETNTTAVVQRIVQTAQKSESAELPKKLWILNLVSLLLVSFQ